MTTATQRVIGWVEQGLVPDAVIRQAIRRLLAQRLQEIGAADCAAAAEQAERVVRQMDEGPIALVPELANAQHYEVPAAFYQQVLGPRRKYSGCYWGGGIRDLAQAESQALEMTCAHAGLADGQEILELGCGWGSLSLWMAERYPGARITAVSNSQSQRAYIEARAEAGGLSNLRVITADMNVFASEQCFDRVVSVEMFEHMRNWRVLFERIRGWLRPEGRFLLHVFCHRSTPYFYQDQGPSDWMGRHFFGGGLMPSDDLPLRFQDGLVLRQRWRWDGRHYEQTLNAWLANMDARRSTILPILAETYGRESAERWWQRWRIFFMACAELFGTDKGQQWWVSHYLFERPRVFNGCPIAA
jgi:cyclopropane-fatty-acyl-phospholipid synthase